MDAEEGRDVATIDTPCTFMHADTKYDANMKIEETMADLFSNIDSQLY